MPRSQPVTRRRWLRFGPGTLLAVIIAAVVLIGGRPRPQEPRDAGTIVYEADASGKMRRVDAPSAQHVAAPPLWKPEPHMALDRAAELKLSPAQQKRVRAIDSDWQRDKALLLDAMGQATNGARAQATGTKPGAGIVAARLTAGLRDYADLSREYDARRAAYWGATLAALSTRQRAALQ